jgi:hypothetical protein
VKQPQPVMMMGIQILTPMCLAMDAEMGWKMMTGKAERGNTSQKHNVEGKVARKGGKGRVVG